jgi:hypothetical protein
MPYVVDSPNLQLDASDLAALQTALGGAEQVAGHSGTFVMNGATPVVVAAPAVTANSTFVFGLKTVGGTVGAYPNLVTVTPGTGFHVAGTALDTSTYNYTFYN